MTLKKILQSQNQRLILNMIAKLRLKNLCDIMSRGPSGLWVSIRDGFVEILSADSELFFSQISRCPAAYALWIEDLTFHWIGEGPSPYPELKAAALKSLEQSIEQDKKIKILKKETIRKIRKLEPTVLE
jgi:hypothetical protein